jgi:hypothetical protein
MLAHWEQSLPGTPGPTAITVDSNHTAWIAAPASNAIMAWRQPYFYQNQLPVAIAD